MRRSLAVSIALVAFGIGAYRAATGAAAGSGEAAKAIGTTGQAGFVDLLQRGDGQYSKHGWNHYGPGHFSLDPTTGVLTSHGGMGLMWYAAKAYANFVVELEFKVTDGETNSGIFVRVPEVPTSDAYIYHSFEIQINDGGEGIHQTGAVFDAEAPTRMASLPPGEWNAYRIAFEGNRITVTLNGETVVEWQAEPRGKIEDFAERGYIGLQNHDDRSPVHFRNIRVKELP
jgi:hypothetical protein